MEAIKYEEKYSFNDYLSWEGRWELIDGKAYNMAPAPYPKHQRVVFNIARELDENLNCQSCEVYISPVDWKIDENNVVQPDVAIFCETPVFQFFTNTPLLIVEVLSKSTAKKDVTVKYELYQKNGVKYYIMVAPDSEVADIFVLEDGEYKFLKKAVDEVLTFEWESCSTKIDFGKLFGKKV